VIHRLLNPQVLQHPALKPWFYFSVSKLIPGPERMVAAAEQISALCVEAHTQVLLGIEEERHTVALLVTQLPTPLMLYPTILFAYNEGSKAIGGEMVQEAARWIRAAGFTHFLMTNRSGTAEEGFITAVAPGSFAPRQNRYYPSDEAFLQALAEALREEVQGHHRSGVRVAA
jgi:hypothetical protein